jgi:hypothetical protein
MPANPSQRLACHVASRAGAAQLNASNVIFKTEQLQVAAVALHPRTDNFESALNYMQVLICGFHIIPFMMDLDGCTYAQPPASPLHDDPQTNFGFTMNIRSPPVAVAPSASSMTPSTIATVIPWCAKIFLGTAPAPLTKIPQQSLSLSIMLSQRAEPPASLAILRISTSVERRSDGL